MLVNIILFYFVAKTEDIETPTKPEIQVIAPNISGILYFFK
jgi:hypothetical protein